MTDTTRSCYHDFLMMEISQKIIVAMVKNNLDRTEK